MSDYFGGPVPGSGSRTAPSDPAAAWPPAPPPAYGATPAVPGWPAYQGGGRLSGGALAAVIVACIVGSFIVVGILAAIAIPVFLNQRAKSEAAATTVSIPEQAAGLTRLHDARALQLEQQLRNQPGPPEVGVYGAGTSIRAAVAVTRHSMTSKDVNEFLAGAEGSFHHQGLGQVAFSDVDPGRLGGTMRCSATASTFSVCVFADHGAYGTVTLFGAMTGHNEVAKAVREAVEHRS